MRNAITGEEWPYFTYNVIMQLASRSATALVGLLVACGAVKHGDLPDAPSASDAAVDAPPAPVKATVLTLLSDGAADPTAKVLFQGADGSVVSDGLVDAGGHAQAMLPGGGTVSAIRITSDTPNGLTAQITTILGVKPGDDLTFGLKAPGTITNQGGQTTMTATFTPPDAGASYTFFTACGTDTPVATAPSTVVLHFRDSCHGDTFDLLALASGGKLVSPMFLKLTSIKYVSGGPFTIPVGFTTMSTFTVNMTNVADAVSSLSVARSSMIDSASVGEELSPTSDPPAGGSSITVPFPQGFGTRSEVAITMNRADSTSTQRHELHTATLVPSVDVDLGKQQLPWLTGVAPTLTGATWTTVVPGDMPDGMLTQWSGRWNDGARPVTVLWRVIQPVEATGMTLPRLPASYATIDPGQQTVAVTPSTLALAMADYDNVAGYDELRQMPETLLVSSIGSIGAFIDMPFQRRVAVAVARAGVVGGSRPAGFAASPAR